MTMNTERRKFIAGVGAAAASTAVLAGGQALAQGNQQIGTKAKPNRCRSIRNPSLASRKGTRQPPRKQLRRRGEAPQRSISLEMLTPILTDAVEWFSLQTNVRDHDRETFAKISALHDRRSDRLF